MKIHPVYDKLLRKISKLKFNTVSVVDWVTKKVDLDEKNVVVRVDCDDLPGARNSNPTLALTEQYSKKMLQFNINASFYFLTDPSRYYDTWNSDIPQKLAERGFEIGLHSAHMYKQFISGTDGLAILKNDIIRLRKLTNTKIEGIISHGDKETNLCGIKNSDLYHNITPSRLGVKYHDRSINYLTRFETLKCVLDYNGVSYFWVYAPWYVPIKLFRISKENNFLLLLHPCMAEPSSKKLINNFLRANVIAIYNLLKNG